MPGSFLGDKPNSVKCKTLLNEPFEQILLCFNASQNLEPDRIDDKCNILLKTLLLTSPN